MQENKMRWPNGAKVGVCFTFDVDGPTVFWTKAQQNPQWGNSVNVSMGEFGPNVGVGRILRLLKKYDIKGAFFPPGEIIEKYPDIIQQCSDEGHEMSFHSMNHLSPRKQTYDEQKADFEKGLELFEKRFKKRPYGYRCPAGEYDDKTWEFLDMFDFEYESTMMGTDYPYIKKLKKNDIIIMPFHWSTDDWPHVGWNMYPKFDYQGNLQSQEVVYDIWKGEFDGMYALDEGCLYDLTMHPQLTGRPRMIMILERLIRYIKSFPDVWIATPIELARAARKVLS
jgi:peptidoglycan-N-acetylglucosamine deacetylase